MSDQENIQLNTEAELIGTLLQYPAALKQTSGLEPHHFSVPQFGEIYQKVVEAVGRGEHISPVTIGKDMTTEERALMMRCVSLTGSVLNIPSITDMLIDAYGRTQLRRQCEQALSLLDDEQPSAEVMARLRSEIDSTQVNTKQIFQDARQVTEAVIDSMKQDFVCTSTGLSKLDQAMDGGLIRGKLYGFGGRKKMGKTIMASTISHNLNWNDKKHLFICGEMGQKEIHQRSVARSLGIYPSAFRTSYGKQPEVMLRMGELATTMPQNAIYHDAPGINFNKLKQVVAMAKVRYDIEGFILDYWQLVKGKASHQGSVEHLDEVAQWLADVVKQLDIWCITTAQINQTGNTRGGEGLKNACDQFYQIHAEDATTDGSTEGDKTLPGRWLEMEETRYTSWSNIGAPGVPGLMMNLHGPYFEEA
jgi:replicative DNA helicase